jgi:hypothetical protein
MPADLPIVCTLSTDEFPKRLSEMAALGRAALIDSRVDATHARLRFADRADVRDRVEAIVAAESHCCAFLRMRVSDAPGAVVLEIDAPEGAEVVLAELVDSFRGVGQVSR